MEHLCVLVSVTHHNKKENAVLCRCRQSAFKNKNNSGSWWLHWDLKAVHYWLMMLCDSADSCLVATVVHFTFAVRLQHSESMQLMH